MNCLPSLHAIAYCTWASKSDATFTNGELCYVIEDVESEALLERMEDDLLAPFLKIVTDCDRSKHGYRLPTYEERSRILVAGNLSQIATRPLADDIGWHSENSSAKPHPVGIKRPSVAGVFDMLGKRGRVCAS